MVIRINFNKLFRFFKNPPFILRKVKQYRKQIFYILFFAVVTTSFGILETFRIRDYKIDEDNISKTVILSELSPTMKAVSKLSFPLPDKYRYYISSKQGMRNAIQDVNAGGESSIANYHNAIDFAVSEGTPVYAARDGYVKTVYPGAWNGAAWKGHPTYGGLIELVHSDGITTLYAHLVRTQVKEGAFVKEGALIGNTGGVKGKRGSGNSTGPHLHFSVYINIEDMFKEN